jgi:hypothetical protein
VWAASAAFIGIFSDGQHDRGPLNRGEIMTWRLDWHHTPLLVEIASGGSVTEDLVPVSHDEAAQIAVGLAVRYWPADAARLPWVASAYPGQGPAMTPGYYEDLQGRLLGLLIVLDSRMKAKEAQQIHEFVAAGEYELALEELTGYLALAGTPITDQERGDMLALARTMQMDDNVPRTVAFCPRQITAPPGL